MDLDLRLCPKEIKAKCNFLYVSMLSPMPCTIENYEMLSAKLGQSMFTPSDININEVQTGLSYLSAKNNISLPKWGICRIPFKK